MIGKRLFPPLLLLIAVAAAYATSFAGAFQFDDYNVIVNNPVVHSWPALFADLTRGIRPLLKFTYTLNWTLGSGTPWPFHLFNVAVHGANALFVYTLCKRVISGSGFPSEKEVEWGAFGAALLFAVHPVQTEAVTYICGRSTSLMAFFYLGSFLAYVKGVADERRWFIWLVSPLLFVMAMTVKETAVTLPAALLLWEMSRRTAPPFGQIVRRQAIHWLLLLMMLVGLVLHPNYGGLLLYSIETRTLVQNVLSQIHGISYLMTRLVYLFHLNIDPDLPVLTRLTWPVGLEAAGLLAIFAAGVAGLRKRSVTGFGILWFFLHLVPTNSFVPRLDIANERQLYLACAGLFLPIGAGMARLARHERLPAAWKVAAAGCILLLIAATVMRNRDYRSEIALWHDTADKSPRKPRVWNNLGYAYLTAGKYREARDAFRTAVRLKPDFEKARNNLADVEDVLKRDLMRRWVLEGVPAPGAPVEAGHADAD